MHTLRGDVQDVPKKTLIFFVLAGKIISGSSPKPYQCFRPLAGGLGSLTKLKLVCILEYAYFSKNVSLYTL